MIKVIVCGALGRMGSCLIKNILKEKDLELVCGIERKDHPELKEEWNFQISSDLMSVIKRTDCIVEFTNPKATCEHLKVAANNCKPCLIGTTGFTEGQLKEIRNAAKRIPVLLSPNMSVGVNLLFKLVSDAVKVLKGYDIEIIESHHRHKKDAPSGTAKNLADIIKDIKGEKIPVSSIRAGDIVGDHTILFAGGGERIELTHRAHSRDSFAQGTIQAIRFVTEASEGLYNMFDVLFPNIK